MDEISSFGAWLRRARKACDLTQAELAQRVGCAEGTIRNLEADALRPSKQLAARLTAQLGLAPDAQAIVIAFARGAIRPSLPPLPFLSSGGEHQLKDLAHRERNFQLLTPDLPAQLPPLPTRDARPNNLPAQLTPLIGRAQELAALELLSTGWPRLSTRACCIRSTAPNRTWLSPGSGTARSKAASRAL